MFPNGFVFWIFINLIVPMKHLLRTVSLTVILTSGLFVQGCSTVREASAKISPGDTRELVLSTMGTPDDRIFQGKSEAWQYSAIATIGVCEYTVVWMSAALVTGITTYRNQSMGGCRMGMRSVNFEDAPDQVIELRRR